MKYIKVVAFVSSFFFFSTTSSKAFESFPSTASLEPHTFLAPSLVLSLLQHVPPLTQHSHI